MVQLVHTSPPCADGKVSAISVRVQCAYWCILVHTVCICCIYCMHTCAYYILGRGDIINVNIFTQDGCIPT